MADSGTIKSCQRYLIQHNCIKLKDMLESTSSGCKEQTFLNVDRLDRMWYMIHLTISETLYSNFLVQYFQNLFGILGYRNPESFLNHYFAFSLYS